jgi:AcrR family transcriptional regulator
VSLREINTAAGQRNTSALHYHFGSRDGLLRAILAPHLAALRARRAEMIAERRRAQGRLTIRDAAEVLVLPYVQFLDGGPAEQAFVRIARQLVIDPELAAGELAELLDEAAIREALDAIRAELAALEPPVAETRVASALTFLIHAVADRAPGHQRGAALSVDEFGAALVDMFVGILTAPAGPTG